MAILTQFWDKTLTPLQPLRAMQCSKVACTPPPQPGMTTALARMPFVTSWAAVGQTCLGPACLLTLRHTRAVAMVVSDKARRATAAVAGILLDVAGLGTRAKAARSRVTVVFIRAVTTVIHTIAEKCTAYAALALALELVRLATMTLRSVFI